MPLNTHSLSSFSTFVLLCALSWKHPGYIYLLALFIILLYIVETMVAVVFKMKTQPQKVEEKRLTIKELVIREKEEKSETNKDILLEEKPDERKPDEGKPDEGKPDEKKPVEEKPVEEKPVEEKPDLEIKESDKEAMKEITKEITKEVLKEEIKKSRLKSFFSFRKKVQPVPLGPKVYYIDFDGNTSANTEDKKLPPWHELATSLNKITKKGDEIIIRITSGGGYAHSYGFAAEALAYMRKNGDVKVTACIDLIAASGGYMLASVCDRIVCSNFAVIGSVGVVLMVPNANELIKKNGVNVHTITAGKYKRTLDMFSEVTEEGIAHETEKVNEMMQLFKNHIKKYRPDVDVDKIATGETWYGSQAIDHKLVDEIKTSMEVLAEHEKVYQVFSVKQDKDWMKTIGKYLPMEKLQESFMKASQCFL